ncbi:MAG: hypothetical protein CMM01_18640 [Rhodopirellula sp.]|nr:hypothetical protein [Rhodopirellula sp.]MAI72904.1 hypothetical protein [Rhodopirellula sp.]
MFDFHSLTGYFNLNDDQSPMGTEVGRARLRWLPLISSVVRWPDGRFLPGSAGRPMLGRLASSR